MQASREVIGQYIQLPRIAKDFANYLELYYKYQRTYHVEEVLAGRWQTVTASELRNAPFDERLSVLGLLFSRLGESARAARLQDALVTALHGSLLSLRERIGEGAGPESVLGTLAEGRYAQLRLEREAGRLDPERRSLLQKEAALLETYQKRLRSGGQADAMERVREWFRTETETRSALGEDAVRYMDNAFRFLEESLGQGQEMVIFVTELTAGYDTSWLIENFGCDAYFRHNQELLFDDTRRRLREEIAAARAQEAGQV